MSKLFYKNRTSVSANEYLTKQSPLFNDNWQIIPKILSTLDKINSRLNIANKEWIDLPHKFFQSNYQTIKKVSDKDINDELDRLGLLDRDLDCVFHYDVIGKSKGLKGQCARYRIPALATKLLLDCNKEYYYKLRYDTKTKSKVKQSKRDRKVNEKTYSNPVLQYQNNLLDNIEFDYPKVDEILDKETNDSKKCFIYRLLIEIESHTFSDLKLNETDGRMWNCYTALPQEIKQCIKINGLSQVAIIDVCNCYLSCLGEYFFQTYCEIGNKTNTLYDRIDSPAYYNEKVKWNNIFLNPNIDAKDYIGKNWLHSSDKDEIKKVMIRYINGYAFQENKKTGVWSSRKLGKNNLYKLFGECFEREFPLIFKDWRKGDLKKTGSNIGKMYEAKLMLDPSLYNKATVLGVIIAYEYDGCSIFAKDTTKINEFLSFIQLRSLELLGFELIFKNKMAVDETGNVDYQQFIQDSKQHQYNISGFTDRVNKWKSELTTLRHKSYNTGKWDEYRSLKKEFNKFKDEHIIQMEYYNKELKQLLKQTKAIRMMKRSHLL